VPLFWVCLATVCVSMITEMRGGGEFLRERAGAARLMFEVLRSGFWVQSSMFCVLCSGLKVRNVGGQIQ
jgi:hypothetical protein